MYKIKIMKTPDSKYYWVMYSTNGQIICRSDRHEEKLGALYTASLVKRRGMNVELVENSTVPASQLIGLTKRSYGF